MTALVDTPPVYALEIARADGTSPRRARRWLSWVLELATVPQSTIDAAVLAVSELVTNSALHVGGRVLVSAEVTPAGLRLTVHDTGRDAWPTVPGDPFGEHGRGLFIVAALAADLEVTTAAHGTTISALIAS